MNGSGGGFMKLAIQRVCLGLAISATGLVIARFVFRKADDEVTSSASNPESSSSSSRGNSGEEEKEEQEEVVEEEDEEETEILRLNSRFEELQRRKYEFEMRFERYRKLSEYKSMLSLERSQLDCYRREISAMEEEQRRGQDLVMVCHKLAGEIQELRLKNGLLEGKAKRVRRRTKKLHGLVKEKDMRIIGMERKFLKCLDELEKRNNVVKELEGEVKDKKANDVDALHKEKEQVSWRLVNAKSKVSVEDYKCEELENETCYGDIVYLPNVTLEELLLNDKTYARPLTVADDEHLRKTPRKKGFKKTVKGWFTVKNRQR